MYFKYFPLPFISNSGSYTSVSNDIPVSSTPICYLATSNLKFVMLETVRPHPKEAQCKNTRKG